MFSKNVVLLGAFIAGFSTAARAESLEGRYKFLKSECSSGAAPSGFGEGISGKLDGTLDISASQISLIVRMDFKYTPEVLEKISAQVKDATAKWKNEPDSSEKINGLADLQNLQNQIDRIGAGVKCSFKDERSYSVNGAVLTTQSGQISPTECPDGLTAELGKPMSFQIQMKDGLLKLTSIDKKSESGECPKGDKHTAIFERIVQSPGGPAPSANSTARSFQ